MAEEFYVDPVECMGCGYPPIVAPSLMEFAENASGYWQCSFIRQTQDQAEEDEACKGVWGSCCGAVSYRGKDRRIIERIAVLQANRGQFPKGT